MPAKRVSKKILNKLIYDKSKYKKTKTKTKTKQKTKTKTKTKQKSQKSIRSLSRMIKLPKDLPLDVRSDHDIPHFLKALQKKNLTIILVYATWCPHCHTIMPHFDKASQCPTNTISSVKVNETMLSKINDAISKSVNKSAPPIKVDGYPSILIVNKNAEKITDIEPVNDTEILKKVMNIDKQNASRSIVNSIIKNKLKEPNVEINEIGANEMPANEMPANEPELIYNLNTSQNNTDSIPFIESPMLNTVSPPLPDEPTSLSKSVVGGSLMSAMAKATYTLAPAATLLATAALLMKRTRKTNKRSKSKRRR